VLHIALLVLRQLLIHLLPVWLLIPLLVRLLHLLLVLVLLCWVPSWLLPLPGPLGALVTCRCATVPSCLWCTPVCYRP